MRGKAAAQNANRRTAEALERADRIAAELATEKAAHKADVQSLTAELRQVRASIDQAVDERSAERVAAARTGAVAAISDMQTQQAADAQRAVRALWDHDPPIPGALLEDVAQILGVSTAPLLAERFKRQPNRTVRRRVERTTTRDMARIDREEREDPLLLLAERDYRLNHPEEALDGQG